MSIQYKTKSEIAYERLKSDIINSEIDMGAPIVVSRIGEKYGLSSMPIREAIKRLEQDGLIESIHNRGHRVAVLDYMTHLENMLARTILELQMMETVAEHIGAPELGELRNCVESLETASEEKSYEYFADVQQNFFSKLFSYSPYKEIENLWRTYFAKTKLYRFFMLLAPERVDNMANELKKLLDCIESRDIENCKEHLNTIQKENFNVFIECLKSCVISGNAVLPRRFFIVEEEDFTPEKVAEILNNIDYISTIRNNMLS